MKKKVGIDVYFAGSYSKEAEEYLFERGANRLASQLLDKKVITAWIDAAKQGISTGKLFIDSGAYTAHTQGTELDVDAYISYLNEIDEYVTLFAQVDTIPGKFKQVKSVEELRAAPAQSWANYLYMRKRLKSPEKLIPIYHQGEEEKWLRNMLEWTDEKRKHIPYIGLSPANDSPIQTRDVFLERCRTIIADSSNPHVKTHCFGLMTINVLDHIPLTSADSTTWLRAAMYGGIMSDDGVITVSARRSFAPEYLFKRPKSVQHAVRKMVEDAGFDWDRICDEKDYKYRTRYNIHYLMNRQNTLVCKTRPISKRRLF